jgi:hypothetical protein
MCTSAESIKTLRQVIGCPRTQGRKHLGTHGRNARIQRRRKITAEDDEAIAELH